MTRRIYWGLVPLIILLIGIFAVMLMRNTDTEPDINVYKPLSPEEEEQVERNIQDAIEKSKTPTARPGYKLVQHGDHYHEVSISETDKTTQVDKPSATEVPKTKSSGLTYHAELLESNPVKALRLQSEERGHWSKDHIPPFPPSDIEAQSLARSVYIIEYYKYIGKTSNNPVLEEADRIENEILRSTGERYYGIQDRASRQKYATRRGDLLRLTWASLDASSFRDLPSDYFSSSNNIQPPMYNYLLQKQ